MTEISRNERLVLLFLKSASRKVREDEISIDGVDGRGIASAISYLDRKGLISVEKSYDVRYEATEEAKRYSEKGLPEERALDLSRDGKIFVSEIMESLGSQEGRIALAQLSKLGLKPRNGAIDIADTEKIRKILRERREALKSIISGSSTDSESIRHFLGRGGLLREEKKMIRIVSINSSGFDALSSTGDEESLDQLTTEMLETGSWKGKKFRRYDISMPVTPVNGAYYHPLTALIKTIREIFFDMGFTEMTGNYVESSFWNMDALFIPQDHSARDMQDTFYVDTNADEKDIPGDLEKRVRRIHERGFDGYKGWRYPWSESESRKLLLRTHTTASTARYLYEHNNPPVSVFSVERVFRHESVDWKHLAEFHQIEGAVYSREVNLSTLKWILSEFYKKLGFRNIKLIPSYYPYTEPSMDVVVLFNGKEIELGGSGIFRPEVGKILGLKAPAMAWGLGLERLAFLYYDLEDIRSIYNSDIEWLRRFTLKI